MEAIDYDELYAEGGGYDSHLREAGILCKGGLLRLPRARRIALGAIKKSRIGSLLEIGCGVGAFLAHLKESRIRCFGIDVSATAVTLARRHLPFAVHCGRLNDDVFPLQTFDAICMWEVIEHVVDMHGLMRQLIGRLNAGGYLFMSTPNYASSWLWQDLPNDPRSVPPVHVTFWDKPCLEVYLKRMGFESVSVRTLSIPNSAAARSNLPFAKLLATIDAILRPSQRCTLLAVATKANETVVEVGPS